MRQINRGRYRILCGVDFNRASEQAIREAYQLAQRVGHAELHFVHALNATDDASDGSDTSLEFAMGRLETYVRRVLSAEAVDSADFEGSFHVRFENPLQALIAVANQEAVDVIMVGAHDRGGLSQLWHRSALHSLMREAPAPVLVAHPRKYLTRKDPVVSQSSGVYAAVTRNSEMPPPPPSMDADSTSSLCRMHEQRVSRPSDISGLRPTAQVARLNSVG